MLCIIFTYIYIIFYINVCSLLFDYFERKLIISSFVSLLDETICITSTSTVKNRLIGCTTFPNQAVNLALNLITNLRTPVRLNDIRGWKKRHRRQIRDVSPRFSKLLRKSRRFWNSSRARRRLLSRHDRQTRSRLQTFAAIRPSVLIVSQCNFARAKSTSQGPMRGAGRGRAVTNEITVSIGRHYEVNVKRAAKRPPH